MASDFNDGSLPENTATPQSTEFPPSVLPVAPRRTFSGWTLWLSLTVLVGALATAAFLVPEIRLFLVLSVIVPPLAVLPVGAYAAQLLPPIRIPLLLLWGVGIVCLAVWTVLTIVNVVVDPGTIDDWQRTHDSMGLWQSIDQIGRRRIEIAIVGAAASVLISALAFLPSVRRMAFRWLPLNPSSFVHAVALASSIALTAMMLLPTIILGEPPALQNVADNPNLKAMQDLPKDFLLRIVAYAYFWGIGSIVFFVGFPIARTIRGALVRLGLVWPTFRQVLFAIVAAVALVGLMKLADILIRAIWDWFGWPRTNEAAFDQLSQFAISPIGAIVVGVCAGLSEELFIRGALQPRLGILLSNLLFTALHASQYNFDGLTEVFVIGLLLGLIRQKTNTTTSAIVHGLYDFMLLYGSYLATLYGWQ